jgi:hypothetical protein
MCWMCDNPEATFADYADDVVQPMIDRFGWAVQSVERTGMRAPFSYTVGLTRRDLPAAQLLHERALPQPGEVLTVAGHGFEVVAVPHPEAHLFIATGLYGEGAVTALQLVWADAQQRWPWDRGHGGGRGGQPVLGPRARRLRAAG